MERTAETDAFYRSFRERHPEAPERYDVAAFGESAAERDEILGLVLSGVKQATTSLVREYQGSGQSLPEPGGHVVAVDGAGRPRLVFLTLEVVVKPMREVDDAFAFDEGEWDRTRQGWLAGHRRYYSRQAAREGFVFHDELPTVFERFRVIWPALRRG